MTRGEQATDRGVFWLYGVACGMAIGMLGLAAFSARDACSGVPLLDRPARSGATAPFHLSAETTVMAPACEGRWVRVGRGSPGVGLAWTVDTAQLGAPVVTARDSAGALIAVLRRPAKATWVCTPWRTGAVA